VVRWADPNRLAAEFAAVGVDLELADVVTPSDAAGLLRAVDTIAAFSVNTAHPHFLNQLYAHSDAVGVGAEWAAAVLNTNVHTYEAAPVFTLIERAVLGKLARVVGPPFADTAEGLFVPGGSIANLYGLLLARHRAHPEGRSRGMAEGPRLVAFISDQAHYSYLKAAIVAGLGTDNLVLVPTDPSGAMLPAALEASIAAARAVGRTPFFVGATAGTTVTGAFDPIAALSAVCKREGMWLHVDGAWGGAVVFSAAHRHPHLTGLEAADSIGLDAHKVVGLPVQCACFLTVHRGLLRESHGTSAAYLFQPDKLHGDLDLGDLTIQCGRRNDALKLWLEWHALGDAGLAARIDRSVALCRYWADKVQRDDRFRLACPFVLLNVCFWYLPRALRRTFDPDAIPAAERDALHRIAPAIKARMQRAGQALIGFQAVNGLPNFFRAVVPGPDVVTTRDVDAILDTIAAHGDALTPAEA